MSENTLLAAHQWGELERASATALLRGAVAEAEAAGAEFCDVRLSETEELRLYAVSKQAPDERLESHAGMGVRVLVDGVWGFASEPLRGDDDAAHLARAAVANARAAGQATGVRVTLPPPRGRARRLPDRGRHRPVSC